MLRASGFVNYIMFTHNRTDKGDANSAYAQNDSLGEALGQSVMSMIVLLCLYLPLYKRQWKVQESVIYDKERKYGAQQNTCLTTYFPGQPG